MKYEYYLYFWGEIQNDSIIEKELGIKDVDFWFLSKNERKLFKDKLSTIADKHNVIIGFREEEGTDVRLRTVASMVFKVDQKKFPFKYDFGYSYDVDAAEYMFRDGNYSCDCNRSLFIKEKHPAFDLLPCGDSILMEDFKIHQIV